MCVHQQHQYCKYSIVADVSNFDSGHCCVYRFTSTAAEGFEPAQSEYRSCKIVELALEE